MRLAAPASLVLVLALAVGAGGCDSGEVPGAGEGSRGRTAARDPGAAPGDDLIAEDLILVTLDTLRADAVGPRSTGETATPTLDRLAQRGRVFSRAHAHSVMTLPSHATILTGRLPFEHGVRSNGGFRLPDDETTLAEILRDEGFATGAFVAAFPLDARFGLSQGFDVYDDAYPEGSSATDFATPERPGSEVVTAAIRWWREHEGQRRFLWVHLFEPHAPYEPPEPFATQWAEDPYLGEVATADHALRPLLEPLLDAQSQETLVAITADHGEALGEHGEQTHGLFAYEGVLAVPLVLSGPGIDPGRDERPAGHLDLLPTLLRRLGIEVPGSLAGRDLLEPDRPQGPHYFEAVDAYYNRGWAPLRGVLDERFKAIELPIPELYDLAEDPNELQNLVRQERRRYRDLLASSPSAETWPPEARNEPVDAEESRRLASLGYVSGGGGDRERAFGPEDDPKTLVTVDRDLHRLIDRYHHGDFDGAIEIGRGVIERRPDLAVAAYFVSQAQLEAERPTEALATLRAARKRGGSYAAANRQLALLLLQAENGDEAMRVASEQAAATPDPESLAVLALAQNATGDRSAARESLRRVLEIDPRNPTALEHLALFSLEERSWDRAADHAQRALQINQDLPQAWNYLGVARSNTGDVEGALHAWERSLSLEPASFDVAHNLAVVAVRDGQIERARRALRSFLSAAGPGDPSRNHARAMLQELETTS